MITTIIVTIYCEASVIKPCRTPVVTLFVTAKNFFVDQTAILPIRLTKNVILLHLGSHDECVIVKNEENPF